ncbi:MAG: hypothetical protein ACLFOY_08220 [Desulfatibacillaceae bacterium]
MRIPLLLIAAALMALAALPAQARVFDESSLTGDYFWCGFYNYGTGRGSGFGILSFDGVNSYGYDADFSDTGLGANRNTQGTAAYTVTPEGFIILAGFPDDNAGDIQGALSEDASVVVIGDVDERFEQQAGYLVRQGSGFNNTSLDGTWFWAGFTENDTDRVSSIGTVAFSGAGTHTYSVTSSSFNAGANIVNTGNGTYNVNLSGTTTFVGFPDDNLETIRGAIRADGAMLLVGDFNEAREQRFGAMVPQGLSYTVGTLDGSYYATGYFSTGTGLSYATVSYLATVEFDGTGGFNFSVRYSDSNNGSNLTQSGAGTYRINADGTGWFTGFPDDLADNVNFAVAAGGDTILVAEVDESGEQQFGVYVRNPARQADDDDGVREDVSGSSCFVNILVR